MVPCSIVVSRGEGVARDEKACVKVMVFKVIRQKSAPRPTKQLLVVLVVLWLWWLHARRVSRVSSLLSPSLPLTKLTTPEKRNN